MKAALCRLALHALHGHVPAKVLRGLEDPTRSGGDIDLIVAPGRARAACLIVARAAIQQGWYLIWFRDLHYVCSIALVMPSASGRDEVHKLDFQSGFSWYAVEGDRTVTDPFGKGWGYVHSDWADQRIVGALSFFQKLMAAGSLSCSEWERIQRSGADASYITNVARQIGLPLAQSEVERSEIRFLKKWRLRASSAGVRNSLGRAVWLFRACVAHVKCKSGLWLQSGLAVGVSGLDGCGKSTIVGRLISCYVRSGLTAPMTVHLLPSWLPMPHQIIKRKKTSTNYERPYSEPPVKSKLSGSLRLFYYVLAFLITRVATSAACARGRTVVFDRSVLDFASDLTRARIPPRSLPGWLLKILCPAGIFFFVDASPEAVVERKGELTLSKAQSLQFQYHRTAEIAAAARLDGDAPPNDVFLSVAERISAEYIRRLEKRA